MRGTATLTITRVHGTAPAWQALVWTLAATNLTSQPTGQASIGMATTKLGDNKT